MRVSGLGFRVWGLGLGFGVPGIYEDGLSLPYGGYLAGAGAAVGREAGRFTGSVRKPLVYPNLFALDQSERTKKKALNPM